MEKGHAAIKPVQNSEKRKTCRSIVLHLYSVQNSEQLLPDAV